MECWKERKRCEIAVFYRMGMDGYHRCRRIYGDDHAMDAGMKKALRAAATTFSATMEITNRVYHEMRRIYKWKLP